MKLHSNIYGWEYVWEEFAEEMGGTIVRDHCAHGGGSIVALEFNYSDIGAISICSTSAGTAVICNYVPEDHFVFRLFVEKAIHRVEKVFGLQDIVTGDAEFDKRYIIQSNDEPKVKQILAAASIRRAMLDAQVDNISVVNGDRHEHHATLPEHHNLLVCTWAHFIDKYDQLEAGYQVVAGLLEAMAQCGSVYRTAGGTKRQVAEPTAPGVAPVRLHSPLLGR